MKYLRHSPIDCSKVQRFETLVCILSIAGIPSAVWVCANLQELAYLKIVSCTVLMSDQCVISKIYYSILRIYLQNLKDFVHS